MSGRRLTEDELRDAGLPAGVLDLAVSLWNRAEGLQGSAPAGSFDTRARLLDLLTAPLRLEPDWPTPPTPIGVGDGWVHAELIDADLESFHLLRAMAPEQGPERLAALCQELRLPVSPYRTLPNTPGHDLPVTPRPDADSPSGSPASPRPHDPYEKSGTDLSGVQVLDLSTHWSGPLITKLLADAGATVIKVDPDCRPDGFRERSDLYRHLNENKTIIDLDLRRSADRQRFERLLTDSDLLVESFSRRVMGNLGYAAADLRGFAPGISVLSVKAFPAGAAEQDWLAFGPGVHAASGLAMAAVVQTTPTDGPRQNDPALPRTAPVAYPDLLTGLSGFCSALELLGGHRQGEHAEVSLRGTIEPLVRLAACSKRLQGRSGDGVAR